MQRLISLVTVRVDGMPRCHVHKLNAEVLQTYSRLGMDMIPLNRICIRVPLFDSKLYFCGSELSSHSWLKEQNTDIETKKPYCTVVHSSGANC